MRIHSIDRCNEMIRHYAASLAIEGKPARWYELCRLSIATWQAHLHRAESA